MKFNVLGDSNIDRFWKEALEDRKEMKGDVTFTRATSLARIESAASSITKGHLIMSVLTNPIVDHVESIGPASQNNLEKSISTILTKLLDEIIYPLCYRLKDSKVSFRWFQFIL